MSKKEMFEILPKNWKNFLPKQRRILVRYPIPKLPDLERSTKKFADFVEISYGDQIYRNIRAAIGDILGSYEDIFRERKRITKAKECMQQNLKLIPNLDMRKVIADEVKERCGIDMGV
jgi:hypothetical protein